MAAGVAHSRCALCAVRRFCGLCAAGLCLLCELCVVRFALINPPWTFDGSIYFGCREPHLPLEYGYSKALLETAGHDIDIVDAQLDGLSLDDVRERVRSFEPEFTVVTTAPSYLFWRCALPELR